MSLIQNYLAPTNTRGEGFNLLPKELSLKILSYTDLQTLFNTAYSFAGNSYQLGNEYAGLILEKKFVNLDKDNSNLKQLFDYLFNSRAILSKTYKTNTSKNLFSKSKPLSSNLTLLEFDLNELKKEIANQSQKKIDEVLLKVFADLRDQKKMKVQENTIQLLIENGSKVNLESYIRQTSLKPENCISDSTIEQILSKDAFIDTINLSHVFEAVSTNRSRKIINTLIDKMEDDISPPNLYRRSQRLYKIVHHLTISESMVVRIINKTKPSSGDEINKILKNINLAESITGALLKKIDPLRVNEASLESLTQLIWGRVINDNVSHELLKILLKVYTQASLRFDLKKYEDNIPIDEELILSLAQSKASFSLNFLQKAIEKKMSSEVILTIYKNISSQADQHACFLDDPTRSDALKYMFNSKSFEVIYDLNEMGERPDWNVVRNAICEESGEYLIHLLLDSYEKGEKQSDKTFFNYLNTYYSLLDKDIKHKSPLSIVKRIQSKAVELGISASMVAKLLGKA